MLYLLLLTAALQVPCMFRPWYSARVAICIISAGCSGRQLIHLSKTRHDALSSSFCQDVDRRAFIVVSCWGCGALIVSPRMISKRSQVPRNLQGQHRVHWNKATSSGSKVGHWVPIKHQVNLVLTLASALHPSHTRYEHPPPLNPPFVLGISNRWERVCGKGRVCRSSKARILLNIITAFVVTLKGPLGNRRSTFDRLPA